MERHPVMLTPLARMGPPLWREVRLAGAAALAQLVGIDGLVLALVVQLLVI